MNVLFQSRTSLLSDAVGDTTQVLKTKEYLEKLGVKVDISLELEPDVSGYDIVHIFNSTRPHESFMQARSAKRFDSKVVLSTIFVDYTEYELKGRGGVGKLLARFLNKHQKEYVKLFIRAITTEKFHKGTFYVLKQGFLQTQRETTKYVDMFLPNSLSEWNRFVREMDIDGAPYRIIPNAVDQSLFNPGELKNDPAYDQFKDCVLCVARIDGRKNQCRLAKAMENVPAKLVLVGKPSGHHQRDFKKIQSLKQSNLHLLGEIPHEKLPSLYAIAKVHALPSFFETTGLSSLEAGIMGCNIVVGGRGDEKDYFKSLAYYCEPDSVDSIRQAVLNAMDAPVNPELESRIRKNYVWDITAQKTLVAYEEVLRT